MHLHPKIRERYKKANVISHNDRCELVRLLRKIQRWSVGDTRDHATRALALLGVEKWEL